jgi:large subunit ribosomal protein L21e
MAPPSSTLITYRRGDVVDVKVNGAHHKGQPYKTFHGKTGTVFNVTKSSVGVQLLKRFKHRLIVKRFHARVEHVNPSRSREDFLNRVKANDALKKEGKAKGQRVMTKRMPKGPKAGFVVEISKANAPEFMAPKPFDYVI